MNSEEDYYVYYRIRYTSMKSFIKKWFPKISLLTLILSTIMVIAYYCNHKNDDFDSMLLRQKIAIVLALMCIKIAMIVVILFGPIILIMSMSEKYPNLCILLSLIIITVYISMSIYTIKYFDAYKNSSPFFAELLMFISVTTMYILSAILVLILFNFFQEIIEFFNKIINKIITFILIVLAKISAKIHGVKINQDRFV